MNAKELFLSDGKSAKVFFCGKCRRVAKTEPEADKCCKPTLCECGSECQQYYTTCKKCMERNRLKKKAKRLEDAEKVSEWGGWIFADGIGPQDGYFESVDALLEYCDDEDHIEVPSYAWTCKPQQFARASIGDITEGIYEDSYEDFDSSQLNGVAELGEAIDVFNEANKNILSYSPDYRKAVVIQNDKRGEG